MTHLDQMTTLTNQIDRPAERAALMRSAQDHVRNGRGFWPVVTIDGAPQVVRFAAAAVAGRWTPETGRMDVIPLHALPAADWPRLRI